MRTTMNPVLAASLLTATLFAQTVEPQDKSFLDKDFFGRIKARSIGPVNFGGRIVDFAVDEARTSTFYAATGSGGIWKTVNNGTTWAPVFDAQPYQSIGDIAIAPSDPKVLYAGTGEANNQRSSYWGNGVYKTEDSGKTWKHTGLAGTDHIGRIVVHPRNPEIAYVAAAGALYTPNKERGLYRTKNGGKSWELVKFISEDVGFIDVALDWNEPQNVYAVSYERRRRAWNIDFGGPGSGLWKSADGGDTWTRVGGGLPTGEIGRIGIDVYRSNPKILFAVVENLNPAPANTGEQRPVSDGEPESANIRRDRDPWHGEPWDGLGEVQDRAQDSRRRIVGGEVYRSADAGKTWQKAGTAGGSPAYYYGQIRVDPLNDQRVYVLSVPAMASEDGGKTWRNNLHNGLHVDNHALWISPKNSDHMLLGNDGGLALSYDRGKHWDAMNDLPIGQFYAIGVDMQTPYRIYGGLQDNGTWGIPSRASVSSGLTRDDAYRINGGDGFYVCVDPTDANVIYSESQFGGMSRQNRATGEFRSIKPQAERGSPALRWNWMTPILISPQAPHTIYVASQYVHRSRNRGNTWETISPDLTTADKDKLKGNVPHCTITTLDESPRRSGWLYAGTDDGRVWSTKDGGGHWTELTGRFSGVPAGLWVSRVHCSPHEANVAYVAFTGYREDHRKPHLFVTVDAGESWKSIVNNLPESPINVVREHPRNRNVLFVGQEHGLQCSLDAGAAWHPLHGDMPAVAVHDLVVHPREMDLVVGTHGRGIYVFDIACLEEADAALSSRPISVFRPRDGWLLRNGPSRGSTGARNWVARNPELGAAFSYFLNEDVDGQVTVEVLDSAGKVLSTQRGSTKAGLQTVVWNPRGGGGGRGGFGGGGRGGRQGGGAPAIGAGQYLMRITHGQTKVEHPFRIQAAPDYAPGFGFGEDVTDAATGDGSEPQHRER